MEDGRGSRASRSSSPLGCCLQYSRLGKLSVGPISYSEDESGNLLPLVICKRLYRKRSMDPVNQVFVIDTDLERGETSASSLTPKWKCCALVSKSRSLSFFLSVFFFPVCLSFPPKSVKQWKIQNPKFLDLDFYRYAAAVRCCFFQPQLKLVRVSLRASLTNLNTTSRFIEITVTFQLDGINLQTVRLRELPDCYTFNISVHFEPFFLILKE